jgi:hypothetical protein
MTRDADAGGRDDDRPPDWNAKDADDDDVNEDDDDDDARNDLELTIDAAIDEEPLRPADENDDDVRRKSRGTCAAEEENEEDDDCCINGGGGGDPNKSEFCAFVNLSGSVDACARDVDVKHRFNCKWRSTTASTLSPRRVICSTIPHTGHTQVCCRRKLVQGACDNMGRKLTERT